MLTHNHATINKYIYIYLDFVCKITGLNNYRMGPAKHRVHPSGFQCFTRPGERSVASHSCDRVLNGPTLKKHKQIFMSDLGLCEDIGAIRE